ncbi:hypothetical protein DM860_009155 [Cuscuta australis]|uniref:Uncharacterized protein n=1 Tax=Cuscuta australis TaxID=267555 RepID=A0A328DDQ8_9ASTE|nr:hypothetical protein DM860_009155 [Cuscuta australis]
MVTDVLWFLKEANDHAKRGISSSWETLAEKEVAAKVEVERLPYVMLRGCNIRCNCGIDKGNKVDLNQVQVRFLKLGKAVDLGIAHRTVCGFIGFSLEFGKSAVVVIADPESVTSLKMVAYKSKLGSSVVLHMSFNERPQHASAWGAIASYSAQVEVMHVSSKGNTAHFFEGVFVEVTWRMIWITMPRGIRALDGFERTLNLLSFSLQSALWDMKPLHLFDLFQLLAIQQPRKAEEVFHRRPSPPRQSPLSIDFAYGVHDIAGVMTCL